MQCVCYSVNGSIHAKRCSLHGLLFHQADICRRQAPALWARVVGVLRLLCWRCLVDFFKQNLSERIQQF